MKKPSFAIFMVLAFFAMACGNSNNSNSTNSSFSEKPVGNFATAQTLPTTDASRYTVGCATAGQSTATSAVDPRLKVGMVFDTSIMFANASATYTAALENTILSVSTDVLVENMKLLAVSGVPNLQPGMSTQATYTLTNGNFVVTYNPNISNYQIPSSNCDIDLSTSSNSTESLYSGQFTDASGNVFIAQELIAHMVGNLTCSGSATGAGTLDLVEIVTNDVPSEGSATYCGGVPLFVASTVKQGYGTLIQGVSMERTLSVNVGN
jgi:hypothetical protein